MLAFDDRVHQDEAPREVEFQDWTDRGTELLLSIPSSMLPICETKMNSDYRSLFKLDDSIEAAVTARVKPGRGAVFSAVCRFTFPLAAVMPSYDVHISRALFKLNEVLTRRGLREMPWDRVASLCEAPGSYVQCIAGIRMPSEIVMHSMPTAKQFPAFDPRLQPALEACGAHVTEVLSNICTAEGRREIVRVTHAETFDLVTADGGRNSRFPEDRALLALAQFVVALRLLRVGTGVLILKLLDLSHSEITWRMLFIANQLFTRTALVKPEMSRPGNTEVFLVAENFAGFESIDQLEVWLCLMESGNSAECPFRLVSPFDTFIDWTFRRFERARHRALRFALQATKCVVRVSPVASSRDMKPITDTCLRNATLQGLATDYLTSRFPLAPGVTSLLSQDKEPFDAVSNLQDLLESIQASSGAL